MIKSSVKVKYVNSCHPDKRDGLLKANLDNLEEGESPFHNNIFTYYENRPILEIDNEAASLNWKEYGIQSWEEMCLADFVSCYDIIYGEKKQNDKEDYKERVLLNNKGKIKLRQTRAILRYYLRYECEEELKRAKLLLFNPFRSEMEDIHEKDIKDLYECKKEIVNKNHSKFENMTHNGKK